MDFKMAIHLRFLHGLSLTEYDYHLLAWFGDNVSLSKNDFIFKLPLKNKLFEILDECTS